MLYIIEIIKSRPELAVILAALSSMIIYQLKTFPTYVWQLYTRFFTINLEVDNQCEAFFLLDKWLSTQKFSNKNRNLQLSNNGSEYTREDTILSSSEKEFSVTWRLTSGFGFYIFFYKNTLVVYNKTRRNEQPKKNSVEIINGKLTAFTRNKQIFIDIVDCLLEYAIVTEGTPIYSYSGDYWTNNENRKVRPLNSVILKTGQMEKIVSSIESFLKSEGRYISKGIPYRKGYLFSGPPGTGKTSTVLALAAHFNKRVYIISLSSAINDKEIFKAITETGPGSFIVLEDVDCVKAMLARSNSVGNDNNPSDFLGVTMQGLLNILDGIMTPEDRIYFMTTNHPEKLDAAFLRPGRVDMHEVLDKLNRVDQERMADFFYENNCFLGMDFPVSPAELQKAFMINTDDAVLASKYLLENKHNY